MNIMIVTSKEYAKYSMVMLESLYDTHREETVNVYIVSSVPLIDYQELFEAQANNYNNNVILIQVDDSKLEKITFLSNAPHTILYKLLVADILPEDIDRVLVLDIDIIITKSLKEFYDSDFGHYTAVACEAIEKQLGKHGFRVSRREDRHINLPSEKNRFNIGVVLYNVEKLRLEKMTIDKIVETFNGINCCTTYPDEMLFNILYYNETKPAPAADYNLPVCLWEQCQNEDHTKDLHFATIIHYYGGVLGAKPWENFVLGKQSPLDDIWWKYAKRMPFYSEFQSNFGTIFKNKLMKINIGLSQYINTVILWKAVSDLKPNPVENYLYNKHYTKIAIYGCNSIQDLLCHELASGKKVTVKYLVDSYNSGKKLGYTIKKSSDCTYKDVDAVIITAYFHYDAIIKNMPGIDIPILSFDDLIEELLPEDFYIPNC